MSILCKIMTKNLSLINFTLRFFFFFALIPIISSVYIFKYHRRAFDIEEKTPQKVRLCKQKNLVQLNKNAFLKN